MKKGSGKITLLLTFTIFVIASYEFYLFLWKGPPFFLDFIQKYGLIPAKILAGNALYTLVTHIFLHGNLLHLFFNSLALLGFGYHLESDLGSGKLFIIFISSGILGGLAHIPFAKDPTIPLIGSSGAIFGMIGTLTLLHPLKFAFPLLIPLPIILFSALYVLMATALVTLGLTGYVAHAAHLGGFLCGTIFAILIRPEKALISLIAFLFLLLFIIFLILFLPILLLAF